jgi:hypothetical protein
MLFPFFGPPIAQALRGVEAVVDVRWRARAPSMARRSQCAADARVCTHRSHPDAEGQGHGGPLVSDGVARRCGQRLRVVEPRSAGCAPRLRPLLQVRAPSGCLWIPSLVIHDAVTFSSLTIRLIHAVCAVPLPRGPSSSFYYLQDHSLACVARCSVVMLYLSCLLAVGICSS